MATNYPGSLDVKGTSLFNFGNKEEASLSEAVTSSQDTIPVSDLSKFYSYGGIAWIENEQIRYTGRSASSGAGNLTGVTRGYGSTTQAAHASGKAVQNRISGQHVENLLDAVIAIQTLLGTNGGNYVDIANAQTITGSKTFSHADGVKTDKITPPSGTLTVAGNLTITGATTTVESTNLAVEDNVILVNKDEAGAGVTLGTAGIEVERGSLDNALLVFRESDDVWGVSYDAGATIVPLVETTRAQTLTNKTLTNPLISALGPDADSLHTLQNVAASTIALYSNKLSVFAATTSAELAGVISDGTGTGALVFANSPTLVTPDLGTPSAAILTNATGLPISTGVAGLGTGVADFLSTPSSANLLAAITDETGTGALVFGTSPTLTTSVVLAISTQNYLLTSRGANLAIQGQTSASVSALEFYTKDGDGTDNIGLSFFGVGSPGSVTNSEGVEIYWDSASGYYYLATFANGATTARPLRLYTPGNTSQVVLDTSGNVGIGATSPGAKLTIQQAVGSAAIHVQPSIDASAGTLTVNSPSIHLRGRYWSGGVSNNLDASLVHYVDDDSPLVSRLSTVIGGTEIFHVYRTGSEGRVGIGTSSPDRPLHIAKSGAVEVVLEDTSQTTDLKKWRIQNFDQKFNIATISDDTNTATNVLTLLRSGNVGIGVSPSYLFDVQGSAGDVARIGSSAQQFFIAADSQGVTLLSGVGQTGQGIYANNTNDFLALYTNDAERVRILTGGNVLFGATAHSGNGERFRVQPMAVATNTGTPVSSFYIGAANVDVNGASIANYHGSQINADTLDASSAKTITNAATWYISAAPIAGTNVTITNTYALWVDSGASRFDGAVHGYSTLIASYGITNNQIQIGGDKIYFGTAQDTNIYRSGANLLTTDDTILTNVSSGYALLVGLTSDANYKFRVGYDGKLEWGAGGASAIDTNLYRSAANVLRTDDSLEVGSGTVAGSGAIRLPNAAVIGWRNAANSANLELAADGSDRLQLGGAWATATSATAGTNGDVPAQVVGYLRVTINGTEYKIPYYGA